MVPTTPTSTDALLERKKIQEEIAILTQARDTLRRECGELDQVKELIGVKIREYNSDIETAKSNHGKYEKLSNQAEAQHRTNIIFHEELSKMKTEEERALTQSIDQKSVKLSELILAIDDLEKDRLTHQKLTHDTRNEFENTRSQRRDALEEIEGKIIEAQKLLQETEDRRAEHDRWIIAEDNRLARMKSDLKIYEARIRKMANEENVQINIVL